MRPARGSAAVWAAPTARLAPQAAQGWVTRRPAGVRPAPARLEDWAKGAARVEARTRARQQALRRTWLWACLPSAMRQWPGMNGQKACMQIQHISQNLESTTSKSEATSKKTKKNANSNSGGSKRSRSGSNQPHPLPIELPETIVDAVDAPVAKAKATRTKKVTAKKIKKVPSIPMQPLDSPAMGTRSKEMAPASPAMSTRSKRRLSL